MRRLLSRKKAKGPWLGQNITTSREHPLVLQVVERAGGMCELCGVSGTVKKGRHKLIIHHIDWDDQNNTLANLKMICISCHMSLHNKGKNHPQYGVTGANHPRWKGDAATPKGKYNRALETRRRATSEGRLTPEIEAEYERAKIELRPHRAKHMRERRARNTK